MYIFNLVNYIIYHSFFLSAMSVARIPNPSMITGDIAAIVTVKQKISQSTSPACDHEKPFIRLPHVSTFVTLHIFFSPCKLHIYCISSSDNTKLILRLRCLRCSSSGLPVIGSTSSQSWRSPCSYNSTCSG